MRAYVEPAADGRSAHFREPVKGCRAGAHVDLAAAPTAPASPLSVPSLAGRLAFYPEDLFAGGVA